jgi:hypothetical protein
MEIVESNCFLGEFNNPACNSLPSRSPYQQRGYQLTDVRDSLKVYIGSISEFLVFTAQMTLVKGTELDSQNLR